MRGFAGVEDLEEFMTRPTRELEADLARRRRPDHPGRGRQDGPDARAHGEARRAGETRRRCRALLEIGLKEKLQSQGIECLACDLLDRATLERLPRAKNVVFMAGHKFGAAGDLLSPGP